MSTSNRPIVITLPRGIDTDRDYPVQVLVRLSPDEPPTVDIRHDFGTWTPIGLFREGAVEVRDG